MLGVGELGDMGNNAEAWGMGGSAGNSCHVAGVLMQTGQHHGIQVKGVR